MTFREAKKYKLEYIGEGLFVKKEILMTNQKREKMKNDDLNYIDFPIVQDKWFEVHLNDGNKLVAEANEADGYKEVCVYLSDYNGNIFQDLAVIGQQTKYVDDKGVEGIPHKYSVKVYADSDDEDFTHEFVIEGLNDGKTWEELCNDAENDSKYAIKAKDNARAQLRAFIMGKENYDIDDEESPEDEIERFLDEWVMYFDEKGNLITWYRVKE